MFLRLKRQQLSTFKSSRPPSKKASWMAGLGDAGVDFQRSGEFPPVKVGSFSHYLR